MILDSLLAHISILGFALATVLGVECVRHQRHGWMMAARCVVAGAALLTLAVLLRRGMALNAFPIVSAYETHLFFAVAIAATSLGCDLLRGWPIMTLGGAPLACLALLMGVLVGVPGEVPGEWVRSAWTGVHVLAVLTAYSAFGLAFVAGALYLIEQRQLKLRAASHVLGIMPSLETMGRFTIRAISVGVALLTAGILIGYLYARRVSLPQGWRLDAKVWSATLTWLIYVLVWGLSRVPAFKGRRTAIASVVGFLLLMVTFWVAAFWSTFHRFL